MSRYKTGFLTPLFYLCVFFSGVTHSSQEDLYPEIDEVDMLLSQVEMPAGVVFHTMEQGERALQTLLPRIIFYTRKIRSKYPALDIAVVSHGDEIFALKKDDTYYSSLQQALKEFISKYQINYHLCGAFLRMNNLEESDFAEYFDIVPFGPSQIRDYRDVGYQAIGVEVEW